MDIDRQCIGAVIVCSLSISLMPALHLIWTMAVQCHADGWRAVETSWSEAERHTGDLNFVWCFRCNRSCSFLIGMFHFRFLNSDKAFAKGLQITVTELLPMDYNFKHLVGFQVSL